MRQINRKLFAACPFAATAERLGLWKILTGQTGKSFAHKKGQQRGWPK